MLRKLKSKYYDADVMRQSISSEDVKMDVWYSFTLNLPEQKNILLLAYDFHKEFIEKNLGHIDMNYEFTIEQSKYGRPHLHGIVKFHTTIAIVKWYEFLQDIHWVNYSFDTIEDFHKWMVYIEKQRFLIEPYLDLHNRPYKISKSDILEPVGLVALAPKRGKRGVNPL